MALQQQCLESDDKNVFRSRVVRIWMAGVQTFNLHRFNGPKLKYSQIINKVIKSEYFILLLSYNCNLTFHFSSHQIINQHHSIDQEHLLTLACLSAYRINNMSHLWLLCRVSLFWDSPTFRTIKQFLSLPYKAFV